MKRFLLLLLLLVPVVDASIAVTSINFNSVPSGFGLTTDNLVLSYTDNSTLNTSAIISFYLNSTLNSTIVSDSMTRWYPLAKNPLDYLGSSDASIVNTPVFFDGGLFDGFVRTGASVSDGLISLPTIGTTAAVCFMTWFQIDDVSDQSNYLLGLEELSTGLNRIYCRIESGGLLSCADQRQGSSLVFVTSTTNVSDGQRHHMARSTIGNGESAIYIDGVKEDTLTAASADFIFTDPFGLGARYSGGSPISNIDDGNFSNFAMKNSVCTDQEVRIAFEAGRNNTVLSSDTKLNDVWIGEIKSCDSVECTAPLNSSSITISAAPDTIDISVPLPLNGESFGVPSVNVNATVNTTNNFNCSLRIDEVVNQTKSFVRNSSNSTPIDFDLSYPSSVQINQTYYLNCSDGITTESTTPSVFFVDTIEPNVVFGFPNSDNSTELTTNLTLNITITDDFNFLTMVNVTDPLGTKVFSVLYNTSGFPVFVINDVVNNSVTGRYVIRVDAADGHTKKLIKNIPHTIKDKEIKFKEKGWVNIYPTDKDSFSEAKTKKLLDRHSLIFERSSKPFTGSDSFYVESDQDIEIMQDSEFKGHMIVKVGSDWRDWYWVDFETDQDFEVEVTRVNNGKVKVKVFGDGSDYEFKSIGQLNVVTLMVSYFFQGGNITVIETADAAVLSFFPTTLTANVSFNTLIYNQVNSAILTWNNTNFTVSQSLNGSGWAFFSQTITPVDQGVVFNVTRNWHINLTDINGTFTQFTTDTESQTLYRVNVSPCNTIYNHTIYNLSYFDEISGESINATNAFDLSFFDGTFFYNTTTVFPLANNNSFCSNLDPAKITFNWNVFGTLTLSKPSYITRIFTIPEGAPTLVSNNPITQQDLFLILIANSSTITYTWQTTEFQTITGTMKISTCNLDGTKSLVDSTPITGGIAIGNQVLLTQPYSYEVVIGDTTFSEAEYNTCHIEASTERSYFVEVSKTDVAPVMGLFFIDCTLVRAGDNLVNLTFSSNPQQVNTLETCVVAKRNTVTGQIQFFRNCTNGTSGSLLNQLIPDPGSSYFVVGEITQDGTTGQCRDSIAFTDSRDAFTFFGGTGTIALILLIAGFGLLYAGQGAAQAVGGVVALIVGWFIGIQNFDWVILSALMSFLLGIAFIVRNSTRK